MTDALILSNALDTNGQNARYVQAAKKYGGDERVLEALAIGKIDPGGVVMRLQEASDRHPEAGLHIRSAHRENQYFQFPIDIDWGPMAPRDNRREVRRLAIAADVIHLNNHYRVLTQIGLGQRPNKPLLLHHHGSLFRNNKGDMFATAERQGMIQAVSTVDLQRLSPSRLHWLPTAYDVAQLRTFGLRNAREPDGRVRIGHFPTNRKEKGTEAFLAAIRELQAEGLPIDLIPDGHWDERDRQNELWLPRWDWNTTMLAKATCDILFDQIKYGYGCNAVEAWAMGIPVISGADDWTTSRMKALWGKLPYEHVTERTVKRVIKRLVLSKDARYDAAQRGVAHVMTYHDELPALEILAGLYHDAITLRRKPRIEGKGVTFVSNRAMRMHVDGQEVHFKHGKATVTDEVVVEKLRQTANSRRNYGIKEEDVA